MRVYHGRSPSAYDMHNWGILLVPSLYYPVWTGSIYVFDQIRKNFRYLFSYSLAVTPGIPTAHKTSCALFGFFFPHTIFLLCRLDNLFPYLCSLTHYSLTIILLISQPNGSFILYTGTAHPAVGWLPDKPLVSKNAIKQNMYVVCLFNVIV